MFKIKPIYLIALMSVIALVVVLKVMNPHKKYSRTQFWQTATLASVADVPDAALKPNNKNGGVLMWAATGTENTDIIRALVKRGADANESDPIFNGTPLSGAAIYNKNPEILTTLVELGADINKKVSFGNTALHTAAEFGTHEGVVAKLIELGIDVDAKNLLGQTALEIAERKGNQIAIAEIKASKK